MAKREKTLKIIKAVYFAFLVSGVALVVSAVVLHSCTPTTPAPPTAPVEAKGTSTTAATAFGGISQLQAQTLITTALTPVKTTIAALAADTAAKAKTIAAQAAKIQTLTTRLGLAEAAAGSLKLTVDDVNDALVQTVLDQGKINDAQGRVNVATDTGKVQLNLSQFIITTGPKKTASINVPALKKLLQ